MLGFGIHHVLKKKILKKKKKKKKVGQLRMEGESDRPMMHATDRKLVSVS